MDKTRNKLLTKENFLQLIKFGLIGVMNTAISLGVIYIMMNVFNISYKLSNILGYTVGLINSFLWNRFWTFKSGGHWVKEALLFLMVFGICFGVQFVILLLLVEKLHLSKQWAQPVSMVFYTGLNFLLNKFITFSRSKDH